MYFSHRTIIAKRDYGLPGGGRPVAVSCLGRYAGTKLPKLKDCRYKECDGLFLHTGGPTAGRPHGPEFEIEGEGNVILA